MPSNPNDWKAFEQPCPKRRFHHRLRYEPMSKTTPESRPKQVKAGRNRGFDHFQFSYSHALWHLARCTHFHARARTLFCRRSFCHFSCFVFFFKRRPKRSYLIIPAENLCNSIYLRNAPVADPSFLPTVFLFRPNINVNVFFKKLNTITRNIKYC